LSVTETRILDETGLLVSGQKQQVGVMEIETTLRDRLAALGVRDCGVLVGVSGGPDSMALLRGLISLREETSLRVVAGHVDHGLREASAEDAAWVAQESEALAVPIDVRRLNVGEFAKESGGGIEETARRVRYDVLTEIAAERECRFLAVAHTADDQAETILHHLVRGTGLGGLRGMPQERELTLGIRLIRPLLQVRREQVQAYLSEIGQTFREDESNSDPSFTRNRIRRRLLPLLREEFNPRVEEALLRLGGQVAEVQDVIEFLSEQLLSECLLEVTPGHVRLNCQPLTPQPPHLVREVLKTLWDRQHWPRGAMTFEHWDHLAQLATGERRGASLPRNRLTLPGAIDAQRRGGLLMIGRSL
jgi:tRNA(Ile)-lysidine synthase